MVFSRNIMYAAFSLLFTFFGVAGLYVLLQADFLAVTQILIYVGGILVLLLFGVMLTNNVVSVDIKTGTPELGAGDDRSRPSSSARWLPCSMPPGALSPTPGTASHSDDAGDRRTADDPVCAPVRSGVGDSARRPDRCGVHGATDP